MLGIELNSALAFWCLTRIVVPACLILIVLALVDVINEWKDKL